MSFKVKLQSFECEVLFKKYACGQTAIQLVTTDGEPCCVATAAVPGATVDADEVLVKDYGEQAGVLAALHAAGLIYIAHGVVEAGFAHLHRCKLKPEALTAMQAVCA